jgi:hypothetical protein
MKPSFSILAASLVAITLGGCSFSPPVKEKANAKARSTHRCVALPGESCLTAAMIDCHDLFADGCLTGATKKHECISRSGPPCTQTDGWECPEGFLDGCDSGSSPHHLCLPTNGGVSCDTELSLECPVGFRDLCSVPAK